ncbi:ShlB/FhaC/HecB family hemolysin secretion/activation protein, partial [Salmonella enterica]
MTIYKFFTEQSSFARLSKLFIFPLFLSASLLTTAVQAAPSAPLAAIERQNQLIQNQQQERLREDQQRALGERPAPGGTNLNNIKPRVASPDIGVQCRNISRIEITGDEKMIPAKLLAKVRHDYTGRCISVSDIESLLGLLTKDFIDRGFITTRVYLPVQDLRTGILKLTVVAGKIEGYKLEGGRKHAVWLRAAMPGREGDVLNLRDLEQGIDQMNSLSS